MEDRPATPKRRLRVPVLTVLVCALVAIAFLHIDVVGFRYRIVEDDTENDTDTSRPFDYPCPDCRGWPVPFATPVRPDILQGAICDLPLATILIAATAVVVLRLERRDWTRWQFSIADMFSLIATTSMVLGLTCLDGNLCDGNISVVKELYTRLCDLPLFDRAMVLFAIACAVWLIVSTAANRLGDKYAKKRE
jgi:hypothetical protein